MIICERAFDFALHARCLFAEGDWEVKRKILSSIGSNLTLKDRKALISVVNPVLIGIERTINAIPEGDLDSHALEPEKRLESTGEFARLEDWIPSLLRNLNDVRTRWLQSRDTELFKLPQLRPHENRVRMAA